MSRRPISVPIPRWRFLSVCLVCAGLAVALVWHAARLQVVPGESRGFRFLQDQGAARTIRSEVINAHRGVITDRHGEPLAVSTPVVSLWANPAVLSKDPADIATLADLLAMKLPVLQRRLDQYRHKEFVYLRRQLPPEQAQKILALDIDGVYGQQEYRRFYPAAEVASHLVGFTNIDDHGQEGIELAFNDWLSGEVGEKQVVKDLKGRIIKGLRLVQPASPGKDLMLSVDLRMQYLAYRELKRAVTQHSAQSGSVVVLDVKSGEVLAMVNQPSYNPNNRSGFVVGATRNRALTDVFEPGSTMKPLTVIAALESGKYAPDTVINTHPGYLKVGKKTFFDPVNYGTMDLTRVITKSSQVGISKVALELVPEEVRAVFARLGLGQATGTGFPGESEGVLPSHKRWQPVVRANFAFGYGLSVTPMQLANAYAVIASGGLHQDAVLVRDGQRSKKQRVVDTHIAAQIMTMLETVTRAGGTGAKAQLASYSVAGKTGTVHKVGDKGYLEDRYRSVFAGMAPAVDPKIVVVVVVDDPKDGKYSGGAAAAPVFARVAEGALRLLGVPPQQVKMSSPLPRGDIS